MGVVPLPCPPPPPILASFSGQMWQWLRSSYISGQHNGLRYIVSLDYVHAMRFCLYGVRQNCEDNS